MDEPYNLAAPSLTEIAAKCIIRLQNKTSEKDWGDNKYTTHDKLIYDKFLQNLLIAIWSTVLCEKD